LYKIKVANKSNNTHVQHSSSSCNLSASGVMKITGSNTVIFAVLDERLLCVLN